MNANRLLISIMGLALVTAPAFARAVPILKGKYAGIYSQTCQAIQVNNDPGQTYQSVTLTDFDPASGTLKLRGAGSAGGLTVWTGGTQTMTTTFTDKTMTYSNDTSTLTADGVVYRVAYGPVNNGIAQSLMVAGAYTPYCAVSIVLIHQ